jgi:NAD(P)-dependent dehydrogenase (short-subunit alcohol dehydrogenase family)
VADIPPQAGKVAVVTGATSGLGFEAALALAKAGADVILTGRNDDKGQAAIDKIGREVPGAKSSYQHLDLASLASVADFAERMQARPALDLLINNAGVMALPRHQTTADGFEMQFGTNTSRSPPGCCHCCAGPADQESLASAAWRTEPGASISMICRAHGCTRHGRPTDNRSSRV